jgi:serine/threonine protein kinase
VADDVQSRLAEVLSDRYTIDRELGAGGMATVCLAEDMKRHRRVAVKVLRPELASALGPDRFLREIEVRGETLDSVRRPFVKPNVVPWTSINETWGVQEIPG